MTKALQGKQVLVTRQKEKTSQFMSLLNAQQACPIVVPLLKIEGKAFTVPDLSAFQWLIFTSANGVDYFFKNIQASHWPAHLKIIAVGHKTNEALQVYGHQADFLPTKFSAKVLAEEFFQKQSKSGKFLLVRGNLARKEFENALIERNLAYETVEVYVALPAEENQAKLNHVLSQQTLDFITFTSPSVVAYFYKMTHLSISEQTQIVCIGPTTAQTAKKYGFKHILIPSVYTVEGMIKKMVEHGQEVEKNDERSI